MKRLDYVDVARALGIIIVILGHIAYSLVPWCGSVHIPLFFLLSGYLYNIDGPVRGDFRQNSLKRAKRLIIPYLIYNILLYLKYILKLVASHEFSIKLAFNSFVGFIYSSSILYKNVPGEDNFHGFVFGNGPLWFLTSMIISSIVFYFVIYKVLKNKYSRVKILASAAVLVIVSIALTKLLPIYLPWTAEMALLGAVFMLIGMCIRKENLIEKSSKMFYLPIIGIVLFAFVHKVNGLANLAACEYGKSMILYIVLGSISSYVILWASLWISKVKLLDRALTYLGQNTLIVLALHMTIISIANSVIAKIYAPLVDMRGYFVIEFVVGLCGCLILNELLTKVLKVPGKYL